MKKAKEFLTFSEVQSFLGIKSRKTVLKYIKSGRLSAYKLGGTRWRISRRDITAFLNYHRASALEAVGFKDTKVLSSSRTEGISKALPSEVLPV